MLFKKYCYKTCNEVCDKEMLEELKNIIKPSLWERMETGLVSSLIGTQKYFGMGTSIATPNKKRGRPKKKAK